MIRRNPFCDRSYGGGGQIPLRTAMVSRQPSRQRSDADPGKKAFNEIADTDAPSTPRTGP